MTEIDELYEALEEARENDAVASACVIYEAILTEEEEENVPSTLLYVNDLVDLGDLARAEACLVRVEELCESVEERELFAYQQGNLAERRGQLEEAEKWYRAAFERNPERADYLLMAAEVVFHRGEAAKAEHLVREALKGEVDREQAWCQLGAYLASMRRFAEAIEVFERVLAEDPDHEHASEWLDDLQAVEG